MMNTEKMINELKPSLLLLKLSKETSTGFFVSRKGHILTCNHAVKNESIEVVSFQNDTWTLPVLARDLSCDLALLKIDRIETQPIIFADPAAISEGQTVFALGHPLGLDFTVSRGVVSSRNRVIGHVTYVQTDVSLNPGNSGGPIVNERGEAIGIADWIIQQRQGLGFAIALRHVFAFAAKLRIPLERANAFPIAVPKD